MLRTDLIDLINSGEMWAFVGSGASIDSGGPSWPELVQGTIERLDESKKQEISRRYQSAFSKEDYAKCFSIIEKSIGRELLENIVVDQLKSVQSLGKITSYLADWPFAGYITTNYDGLIKSALQGIQEHGWLSIGNLPNEARQISGNVKQVIWHVHGSISLPNSKSRLMLTEEDRAIASKVPSGQYFSQIGVIPSGLEPFGLDADLGRLLLLEQTHGNLSQEGHIFWGMAGAYP